MLFYTSEQKQMSSSRIGGRHWEGLTALEKKNDRYGRIAHTIK